MKEDFLYYLWKFQKINTSQLLTTQGESIEVITVGTHNTQTSGPDFFNAQLIINGQKWAGNIEIHVKASDWFVHQHQSDPNYNSVILHVVWEYDIDVFRLNNSVIPVLQLKNYVSQTALTAYYSLYKNQINKWINCENQLIEISSFTINNWLERIYFERLELKSKPILQLLKKCNNNWEATCFAVIAKSFGGNTNGLAFFQIAQSIPFTIVQKAKTTFELEALFFGQANLLSGNYEDPYYNALKNEYMFLKHKFKLKSLIGLQVQFFKHRPLNFPSIRLSQLAVFYTEHKNVFNLIMQLNKLDDLEELLRVTTSPYWVDHYTFDKISKKSTKKISKSFVALLLINAVLPLRFIYEKSIQKFDPDIMLQVLKLLKPESNNISKRFKKLGVPMDNALHSQASLTLKKQYCEKQKCIDCAIGYRLLN